MKQSNLFVTRRTIDLANGHYSRALSDPIKDNNRLKHIVKASEYLQAAKKNLRHKMSMDSIRQINNKLKLGGAKATAEFVFKLIELSPDKKAEVEKIVGVTPKISKKSSSKSKKSSKASASSDKSTNTSESSNNSSSSVKPQNSQEASKEESQLKSVQSSMRADGINANRDFGPNASNSKSPFSMTDSKLAKDNAKNSTNSSRSTSDNK